MSRMNRRSKRQHEKDKRHAQRGKNRRHGRKAGSIAIYSMLPGLEGTELGSMDVVVEDRRTDEHPALINVVIHHGDQERAIIWSIETGFGGLPSRVGSQIAPDGPVNELPPPTWLPLPSVEESDSKQTTAHLESEPRRLDAEH